MVAFVKSISSCKILRETFSRRNLLLAHLEGVTKSCRESEKGNDNEWKALSAWWEPFSIFTSESSSSEKVCWRARSPAILLFFVTEWKTVRYIVHIQLLSPSNAGFVLRWRKFSFTLRAWLENSISSRRRHC